MKSILPVGLLALVGAGFIQLYTKYFRISSFSSMKSPAVMEIASEVPAKAVDMIMEEAESVGAQAVMEKAPEVVMETVRAVPNYTLWFLFGCLFVIVLVVIFEMIKAKREK